MPQWPRILHVSRLAPKGAGRSIRHIVQIMRLAEPAGIRFLANDTGEATNRILERVNQILTRRLGNRYAGSSKWRRFGPDERVRSAGERGMCPKLLANGSRWLANGIESPDRKSIVLNLADSIWQSN